MVAVVFASLRGGNGAGPSPLLCPSLPNPHPCSQTLPAAAHFPAPGENWRVSAGGSLISLLAPFWPSPTALLLFGTGHVQVSEKVGGREPGEEPAGSGHE